MCVVVVVKQRGVIRSVVSFSAREIMNPFLLLPGSDKGVVSGFTSRPLILVFVGLFWCSTLVSHCFGDTVNNSKAKHLWNQGASCRPCDRLFYQLVFNLALPCELRPPQPLQNPWIETTCIVIPDPNQYSWNGTNLPLDMEAPVTINSLVLLELNLEYNVLARQMIDGNFQTGDSVLYESIEPKESRGLQVIATAINGNNQESIVQSWAFSLTGGESICVQNSAQVTVSAGWADTVSLLYKSSVSCLGFPGSLII